MPDCTGDHSCQRVWRSAYCIIGIVALLRRGPEGQEEEARLCIDLWKLNCLTEVIEAGHVFWIYHEVPDCHCLTEAMLAQLSLES
mmetsp:Transcript_27052/g.59412  ORF Transcript_27052/g.59412 Transcript_27052/m.59412 type:complete len:85 (-) Transcript_27052:28-282(-)